MRLAAACLTLAALALPALAGEPEVVNPRALFPEGPAFLDGALYYAEYAGHDVLRWDGSTNTAIWKKEGCGPSAVLPHAGGLLVTCYDSGEVVLIGLDGSTRQVWKGDGAGTGLTGPNDLAPDGRGGAFFSASGPWESAPIAGKIWHIAADGALRMVADDLHYANGLALSPDGTRLFVAESEANRVISLAVAADGSLSDRRLFVRVGQVDPASGVTAYPDGIKFGPDGALWIGQYSKGRIVVVAPDGSFVRAIDLPSPATPNLAFAPDGKAIFVMAVDDTSGAPWPGKVYRVPLD